VLDTGLAVQMVQAVDILIRDVQAVRRAAAAQAGWAAQPQAAERVARCSHGAKPRQLLSGPAPGR